MSGITKIHNVAIIGSGPAGWTAALYLARAGLNPILFEGEMDGKGNIPGGQLMTTTEIENYPGFPDGGISGWEMMERFKKQGLEFGTILLPYTIKNVTKESENGLFKLIASDDKTYFAKSVVIATGATAKYLGLPSEKKFLNRGVSACATCDGALPRFRNKPIIVVGGGDTAMEEALFLARFASEVMIIHRRDKLRASPIMEKRAREHQKIKFFWNSTVEEILGDEKNGVTGIKIKCRNKIWIEEKDPNDKQLREVWGEEIKHLPCSGFFVGIGHKPNSELFLDFVDVDQDGYIQTLGKTSQTGTEGLFACGDVQDKIYRQAVTAAGSGCMAAIDCTRWLES